MRELPKISSELRVVPIKYGFYRIYYRQAYIHEVFKEMPEHGYDFEDYDPRLENQSYFEEYEDNAHLIRTIKNYKEGYWDSLDSIRTRVYLMRNNAEYNQSAHKAYKQHVVK